MAWCPKCKLEYRDGITVCADCGCGLVDEMAPEKEMHPVMSCEREELADKFLDFLAYSNILSGEKSFREDSAEYTIAVEIHDLPRAKKLFRAFYMTDHPEHSEESSDPPAQESSAVYVKPAEKYSDLASSAKIFYFFGVVGLAFVFLNATGLLSWINGILSYAVYTAIFVGCLLLGFSTQKSARKAKEEIKEEESLTEAINQWLSDNIRETSFATVDIEGISDEIRYFNRTNYIKERLNMQFENLDEAYADQLIEDFYNEHF